MSDQTIPADLHPEDVEHARSYVQDFLDATYAPDRTLAVARVLHALLPAPPRPTLEGMTADELAACQWMQADVKTWGRAVIIVPNVSGRRAMTLNRRGHVAYEDHTSVTPRPDLPRLEWPGDTPAPAPAPALPDGWRLADHKDYGRVIVTTKNLVRDGYMGFIHRADPINAGHGSDWCKPDELTYLDTPDAVPESTLAVGSVWDDADALARACEETGRDQIVALDRTGDAYVWDEMAEWWESSAPPRSAPYTIIHAGKKADQ